MTFARFCRNSILHWLRQDGFGITVGLGALSAFSKVITVHMMVVRR